MDLQPQHPTRTQQQGQRQQEQQEQQEQEQEGLGWAVSALDVPHDRGERRRDVVRGAEGVVRAVLARRLLIRRPVRVALVLPRHAPS